MSLLTKDSSDGKSENFVKIIARAANSALARLSDYAPFKQIKMLLTMDTINQEFAKKTALLPSMPILMAQMEKLVGCVPLFEVIKYR